MKQIFDHALLLQRLRRAKGTTIPFADHLAEEVALRLAPVKRDFGTALILFPPHADLKSRLLQIPKIGKIFTVHALAAETPDALSDPEIFPLAEGGFDLALSFLHLQYANDLPGVLAQIRRSLKPDGLCLGCLVGGESLKGLRDVFAAAEIEVNGGVTPRIHPSVDIKQLGSLLQRAKFTDLIVDAEKQTLAYSSFAQLLHDLRHWGGNLLLARSKKPGSRRLFERAAKIYCERHARPDGKIEARFDVLWFSAWAG